MFGVICFMCGEGVSEGWHSWMGEAGVFRGSEIERFSYLFPEMVLFDFGGFRQAENQGKNHFRGVILARFWQVDMHINVDTIVYTHRIKCGSLLLSGVSTSALCRWWAFETKLTLAPNNPPPTFVWEHILDNQSCNTYHPWKKTHIFWTAIVTVISGSRSLSSSPLPQLSSSSSFVDFWFSGCGGTWSGGAEPPPAQPGYPRGGWSETPLAKCAGFGPPT